ncbi:MAG: hypothetical protein KC561_12775, partial [Myxococcales bacterium]|nr:hypothetical protein [Myxococcales bacterium]
MSPDRDQQPTPFSRETESTSARDSQLRLELAKVPVREQLAMLAPSRPFGHTDVQMTVEGADESPAAINEGSLQSWVDDMHSGADHMMALWYQLHDDIRQGGDVWRLAINAINGEVRHPLEQRLAALEASQSGGPLQGELALHRQDWERRFRVILSLQTFRGEVLNGAIRDPSLVGGTTQSHMQCVAGQVRDVCETYERVRAASTRQEAQQHIRALSGNAYVFTQALLTHTGWGPLAFMSGNEEAVTQGEPPANAWVAIFDQGDGEAITDLRGARAEAQAEDAGVSAERQAIVSALAQEARSSAANLNALALSRRVEQLIRDTLTSDDEVSLFLNQLDAQQCYDEFMTIASDSLSAELRGRTNRGEPVDLLELRRQRIAAFFSESASNLLPAVTETLAGFYRGFGSFFNDLGLDFLGDIMTSAGNSFDDLAAEMDLWLGNEDTDMRSTIAHITGDVEAALFQSAVTGEVSSALPMVMMGVEAAQVVDSSQRILDMLQRGGRWLRNASDRVWRIRRIASRSLSLVVGVFDDSIREGKSAEEIMGPLIADIVMELGGLLETEDATSDRQSGQRSSDDQLQFEHMAVGWAMQETGFHGTV